MSSSAWPPELKQWVQDCLAKATPSNKAAVNAELKQILFKAHADGSLNTTNWAQVELDALKAQAHRTTHVPPSAPVRIAVPPPVHQAPPVFKITSSFQSFPPNPPSSSTSPFMPQASVLSPVNTPAKKKKRKNDDSLQARVSFPTPYHFASNEESEALARRAARFQINGSAKSDAGGGAGSNGWIGGGDDDDAGNDGFLALGQVGRKKMRSKMGLGYGGDEAMEVDPNVIDWDHYTIKGTNTKLEKSYLRLTSEPSPADIRPLPILKQTLRLLKEKWKHNHNYAYALDQFKSMRQDLTVQRIKNEFTVEVYEIHARIALEAKDLGEYNQCQTMLRQLYELGIKGHPLEFLSYRIIYLLHTRNRSDMASLLAQLTPAEKADPGVHHALQVHASLATSNYIRFFRLYNTAPNMSGYILDHFVERERMSALAIMSKAYMSLTLPYLTSTLAFDSDQEADEFLANHKAAIYTNPNLPAPPAPQSVWKVVQKATPPTPLADRIWDCKKAHPACQAGLEKYRVVDLKGQVD